MASSSRKQTTRIGQAEFLRTLRDWCAGLGVVALALGVMAFRNTVGNPETWTSFFTGLAAGGAFVQHGVWLAAIGALFVVAALGVEIRLRSLGR